MASIGKTKSLNLPAIPSKLPKQMLSLRSEIITGQLLNKTSKDSEDKKLSVDFDMLSVKEKLSHMIKQKKHMKKDNKMQ